MVIWDNQDRKRYYGLRRGDIVEVRFQPTKIIAEVDTYGGLDNNSVGLINKEGKKFKWVAEWCKIITKVEDR
jgi:hypothetical protein